MGKAILRVSRTTTTLAVIGELGWYDMKTRRDIQILKFWRKLVQMDDNRIVKKVYMKSRDLFLAKKNARSFCKTVLNLFQGIQLEEVFYSEEVGSKGLEREN